MFDGSPLGTYRWVRPLALFVVALATQVTPLGAQTVRDQLSTLFTAQGTGTGQVPDPVAADRSQATLLGLFSIELAAAPLATGTSGFVYRLNPTIGMIERTSESFGAFYTERALRVGHGQLSLGLVAQNSSFSTLQGNDIGSGTFPVNAARAAGTTQPFAVDMLQLELSTSSLTGRATYGVTDAFDVGVAVPFVQTRFSGTRVTSLDGQPVFDIVRDGRASGIGDAALSARYRVLGTAGSGVALGSDLRLPTGRAANLLGTGRVGYRAHAIGTWARGPVEVSGNGGAGFGGASDEMFWSGAATWAAPPRVTLVSELFGRRLADLHLYAPVYQPHSIVSGVDTMRWLPAENSSVHVAYALGGMKWNVAETLLVGANVLVRLTDAGLRARVTPSLTIEYDFTP